MPPGTSKKPTVPSGSDRVHRTRSQQGTLPSGSRNESTFDRLAAGKPSRARSDDATPAAGSIPIPVVPVRASHENVEAIQAVCASENEPLRQELRALAEKTAGASNHTTQETIDAMRREGAEQLDKIMQALEPTKNLAVEVATLRSDYNALMEQQSQVRDQLQ